MGQGQPTEFLLLRAFIKYGRKNVSCVRIDLNTSTHRISLNPQVVFFY